MEKFHELFLASSGVCTDTRTIFTDCFFVCLKGNRFDANTFTEKALALGAKYVISSDAHRCNDRDIYFVPDTLLFLQTLARFHRKKFNIPILGITGSNGKTTTKELVNAVLEQKYHVLATKGNLNNHIGVPLTLLQLTPSHEIAIIEMGANQPGDIEQLCDIALPTHGIVTNIGRAHLEGFGTMDVLIHTKLALFRSIFRDHGVMFCNADDSLLLEKMEQMTLNTYGMKEEAQVKGRLLDSQPFVTFEYNTKGITVGPIPTQLVGTYNLNNFLAAIAVATYFEVPAEKIKAAISQYTPSNNRSQVQKTERNTLILDCYNANPTSVHAALASFCLPNTENKLVILGDMLELGEVSHEEHQGVVSFCQSHTLEAIFVGPEFQKVCESFSNFSNVDELINTALLSEIEGKTILIKGSRGIALEKIIPFL